MSFLNIERVRSEHLVSRKQAPLPPDAILPNWAKNDGNIVAITTKMVHDRSVVEFKRADGTSCLYDPSSGKALSPLSREMAEAIATGAWTGPTTPIKATVAVTTAVGTEFRGPFPAWQVNFADDEGTRIYVDASNGAILAARSDTWRLFDFLWGLHIMDWTQRDRINSWWLLLFGIGGTFMAISGTILLAYRRPKPRWARTARGRGRLHEKERNC